MLLTLVAVAFAIPVVSSWRTRRWAMAFDATGFWWIRGKEIALIPWDSLAGVGICWTPQTRTIELCPRARSTATTRCCGGTPPKPYEKALRQWAPELWFGLVAQRLSYAGQPDRGGHRERMARRGAG